MTETIMIGMIAISVSIIAAGLLVCSEIEKSTDRLVKAIRGDKSE